MNKVICGDVTDLLRKMPDESADLIVADPPYYLLNRSWDRKQWEEAGNYLDWSLAWFLEAKRVLKPTGTIYVFQDWRMAAEYVVILKRVFPVFRNWITWERNKGRSNKQNFKSSKEEILVFSKIMKPVFHEQKKIRPAIARYYGEDGKPKGWHVDEEGNRVRWTGVGNVWHYTPPVWSSIEEKPFHPTQKPLMMLERIVGSSSNPGGLVLDLFAGSGVCGTVCKLLGRNSVSVEQDENYCRLIRERIRRTKRLEF